MPTARQFAYNTGSAISGTEQIGNLAIGTPTSGFGSTGLKWWNGPDEDFGYVIAHQTPSGQPGADGNTAFLGFWRSELLTDNSFISLAETIGGQTFASATDAKTWLNDNGYWTSWEDTGPILLAELDASDNLSYSGTGTVWNDLIGSNDGTLTDGSGAITWSDTAGGTTAGGSFTLNGGTGTRIEFADSDDISLNTTEYKSFVLWFRANNTLFGSFRATIMNKMSSSNNYDGFFIGWDTNNRIQLTTNGTSTQQGYVSTNSFTKNQWYMLTFICKISNEANSTKLYMNTTLEAQGAHGTDTISDTRPLYLGNYDTGVGNATGLVGGIAEMYVYDRELTSSDISSIFDLTKSRFGY